MPMRTSNSIFLLNFDDPDNPLYDECGNIWTAINPQLIYDEELDRYVANFKDGITNSLTSNDITMKLANSDYTVEIYYKIEGDTNWNNYNCLYSTYAQPLYTSCFIQHNENFIEFRSNSKSTSKNSTLPNLIHSWIHLVIVYEQLFSTANIYINGKKEYTFTSLSKITTNPTAKMSIGGPSWCSFYFNGRMAFIHFTKGVLYTSNFDYRKQVVYNKHVHTESNTKRMSAFTYGWNVQRETKWNQKVNMYVMDPDHHISQGKKE